jgi:hypothetical protein
MMKWKEIAKLEIIVIERERERERERETEDREAYNDVCVCFLRNKLYFSNFKNNVFYL